MLCPALPLNKNWTQKVPLRLKLLAYLTRLVKFFGLAIFLNPKAIITANYAYQDYMSTFLLAKNGRVLSSKRTKHIKAKFFFIKHYHHSGKIDLQYCPTDNMWADILTKPLQGSKFWVMGAFLMNFPVIILKILLSLRQWSNNRFLLIFRWSPDSLGPPRHRGSVLRQNTLVLQYHVSIMGWFLYFQIPKRRKWHGKTASFHVTNILPPSSLLDP